MAFFQSADESPQNRKFKGLREPILLEGDLTGLAAIGLWKEAGCTSQATRTDGLLSLADLVGIVYVPDVARQLAGLLVDAGLWHGHGHDCPQGCEPVPPNHWRFHDWFQMRYKPGADLRLAQTKAAEAKRPEIANAVWLRDCEDPSVPPSRLTALCRYCGHRTKRPDHTSDRAPQLDHVDPRRAAGVRNLVIACADCNRRKASRTPEDAGMTLRPAPRALADDVSPATTDAETAAPAVAVSPVAAVVETPAAAPAQGQAAEPAAPSQPGSRAESQPGAKPERPLAGPRTGAPARGLGSGSGSGLGLGSGEGSRAGSGEGGARPARRRSRRRRGRGGRPSPARTTDQLDAGAAPLAFDPPTGGSPWADWSGPPSPISEESVCPTHHLHQPCRKCAGASNEEAC